MFIYSLLLGHLYISLVIGGSPIFCISPTIQNEIQFPTRVSFSCFIFVVLEGKILYLRFQDKSPNLTRGMSSLVRIPADAMNSAWCYVTSLLNVEISLKCVTTGHFPSSPLSIIIREALALKNTLLTGVASGIDPELTPTWTCSPTKPSKQLCNFILPCPWCMFLQEITSRTSPPGFPPPVFACCPLVFGKKTRTVGALIPSI